MFVHFNMGPPISSPAPVKRNNFNKLTEVCRHLVGSIVSHLGKKDLSALDLTLKTTKANSKIHWEKLIQKESQTKELEEDLKEILTDHPDWKAAADGWKGVSLEDKVWLLRLYELHQLPGSYSLFGDLLPPEISFPQISAFFPGLLNQSNHHPSSRTPELLNQRSEIEKMLEQKETLHIYRTGLKKCPKAICLLKNLRKLDLFQNHLEVPPDVSKNSKLENLELNSNKLKTAPDVSQNVHLNGLCLHGNNLEMPPNVSRNPKLKSLYLEHNQLRIAPNLRHNRLLEYLYFDYNSLTAAPDVSQCSKLKDYRLRNNPLSKDVLLNLEGERFAHPGIALYI